jgi:hypothetical protein
LTDVTLMAVTSTPANAHASMMPRPMVPHPMTATFFVVMPPSWSLCIRRLREAAGLEMIANYAARESTIVEVCRSQCSAPIEMITGWNGLTY